MTDGRLCLPVDAWPVVDRELWQQAQEPAVFLEGDKPASHWSQPRRRIGEQAYGQWLAFLDRRGALDPSSTPGQRVAEDLMRAFVLELGARVVPASVGMMVGALLRMLAVLEPGRDWTWLAHAYNHLKARTERDLVKTSNTLREPDIRCSRRSAGGSRKIDTPAEDVPQRQRGRSDTAPGTGATTSDEARWNGRGGLGAPGVPTDQPAAVPRSANRAFKRPPSLRHEPAHVRQTRRPAPQDVSTPLATTIGAA